MIPLSNSEHYAGATKPYVHYYVPSQLSSVDEWQFLPKKTLFQDFLLQVLYKKL